MANVNRWAVIYVRDDEFICQTAICQTYRLLIIYSPCQTCELDQINCTIGHAFDYMAR